MRPLALVLSLFVFTVATLRAAEPFEIKEGDRVLLLGDTLLERENTYGYLETRMQEQFPDRHFTVRNLSWSGETPRGWSRASFDSPDKGYERLKEDIAKVKPTVVFLGFGMAASLQELTDRSGDIALNPDPVRYGAEPMSAARFKKELGELMDAIGKDVRFVLLSPIRHEDLRKMKPGLPDPTKHNKLLAQYSQAIEELAKERGGRFENLGAATNWLSKTPEQLVTDNGIHLNAFGYRLLASDLWPDTRKTAVLESAALRNAVIHKNDLFFHQFRPANSTYLFGFRKHEQGQNAKEMPMFDPLIEAAEKEIDTLKKAAPTAMPAAASATPAKTTTVAGISGPIAGTPPPLPDFAIEDGYQIELWAQNPLLEKPTQMNWDPQGRLWVCSSSLYPQVEPGQAVDDKILVLSDTDGDGKADKSEVFADGLLIPTGVAPDLVQGKNGLTPSACYVGQSTELLYFKDTDGDGKADEKRVVFSGFGTEDTHHIVHTLHWGQDGRLYFHQSVYIHTHMETPWGMVRLNSGGVFAYDPRTERVEVFAKGLWNTWGQQEDDRGQSFLTDGAGSNGVSWAFPGAVFAPFEGSRRQMPSISPGAYPKFAGLEIIKSPHFPAEWQGNMITCDFRAHRIVRFGVTDLAVPKADAPPELKSGFVTTEMPDLVRTTDLSFRPIDVRLGPDGALYVADWSNPVINHGEVDFRDPRRDHHMGRIWRITKTGAPTVKWESLLGKTPESLRDLPEGNRWASEQARRMLFALNTWQPRAFIDDWTKSSGDELPRPRLFAMRALARKPSAENASLVLDAAIKAPVDDPYYEFAAWQSINDLAKPWTDAIASGEWKTEGKDAQLAYGLKSIDPGLASATLARLFAAGKVPVDGTGPWIELIGDAGGPVELQRLLDGLLAGYVGDCCETDETKAIDNKLALTGPAADRAVAALLTAARVRNVQPAAHTELASALFHSQGEIGLGAIRLAGLWKTSDAVTKIGELLGSRETKPPLRRASVDGLRAAGGAPALALLDSLTKPEEVTDTRAAALVAMVQVKMGDGVKKASEVLPTLPEDALLGTWRGLLGVKGAADAFANKFAQPEALKALPTPVIDAAVRAAREAGRPGAKLLASLAPAAGAAAAAPSTDYVGLAAQTKQNGDPAKGELVYRRATSACTTCHSIGGAGGKVGPDMTSIGASAPLDYIIESILNPNAKVKEGFNAVSLSLADGTQATGIQARETASEIILRDAAGTEHGVPKAAIKGKTDIGSMMPAGLTATMQPREAIDLYAFLSQLGKPGAYDASKGKVARVWRLYPGTAAGEVVSASYDPAKNPGFPGYTLVDGRFVKDLLTDAATIAASGSDTVLLTTQFQSSGKTQLNIIGAEKAWLDGQPLVLGGALAPELANGTHTLVVKIGVKELPPYLRAESPDARFLGN